MTERELFRATLRHEPHEGLLFYADFTPDLARRLRERRGLSEEASIRDHFGMFNPGYVAPGSPRREPGEFARYFTDVEKPPGSFINGLGVLEVPAGLYHFTGYVSPLRNASSLAELESFPFPRLPDSEEGMADKADEWRRAGKVVVGGIGHIYENAWQIRGYEQFLGDMVERPSWAHCIRERFAERNRLCAVAGARAGADYLHTGDDIANQRAMMFSPAMWREFLKPRWKAVYEAARRVKPDIAVWYHSDGNIAAVIPELIEIGVTVLNPVQPECMDVEALKREYGRDLVFDGTVGTQTTMPFGTPGEVRRIVRERRARLGADGALMLSPTHVLEPEVPLENVEAFCGACREG